MKKTITYVAKGILVLLPIFVLFWILLALVSILQTIAPSSPLILTILLSLIICGLLGWVAEKSITANIKRIAFGKLQKYTPRIASIMHIINRFPLLGTSSEALNTPVWIHVSNNQKKIGFLIHESLPNFDAPDHVSVIIPSSFSLQAECLVIHKDSVEKINTDSEKALLFAITGGLIESKKYHD